MVAKCLSMVTGENDDSVFPLSCFVKRFKDPTQLLVNQLDHRVIGGYECFGISRPDCLCFLTRCLW